MGGIYQWLTFETMQTAIYSEQEWLMFFLSFLTVCIQLTNAGYFNLSGGHIAAAIPRSAVSHVIIATFVLDLRSGYYINYSIMTSMREVDLDTYSLSLLTAKEDILNPRSSTNWYDDRFCSFAYF